MASAYRALTGVHVYVLAQDGSDIIRFLDHPASKGAGLAGLGWFVVGAGGQLLERSIVGPHGRCTGGAWYSKARRLLDEPLRQGQREPSALRFRRGGAAVDTLTAWPGR